LLWSSRESGILFSEEFAKVAQRTLSGWRHQDA
jgi:hypothetical protein